MKKFSLLLLLISTYFSISMYAQDKRAKIKEYLNQELIIHGGPGGQSFTLTKENQDYFILRQYFGSGVPVVATTKYKVTFESEYQITFSEPMEGNKAMTDNKEDFLMAVEEKGLCLYLNGLKVVVLQLKTER